MAQRNGTGRFPREVVNRFPLLPLEEEGRLNDMPLREDSIERVFAYYRWTRMLDEEPTPGGLVEFHTAHSPKHYTEMGRPVADAGKRDWDELTAEYGATLMEGLGVMGCKRSRRGQDSFDFGNAHFGCMAHVVEVDVELDPADVGPLGAVGIVFEADGITDLIQQFLETLLLQRLPPRA
jgi:hypothetical protein